MSISWFSILIVSYQFSYVLLNHYPHSHQNLFPPIPPPLLRSLLLPPPPLPQVLLSSELPSYPLLPSETSTISCRRLPECMSLFFYLLSIVPCSITFWESLYFCISLVYNLWQEMCKKKIYTIWLIILTNQNLLGTVVSIDMLSPDDMIPSLDHILLHMHEHFLSVYSPVWRIWGLLWIVYYMSFLVMRFMFHVYSIRNCYTHFLSSKTRTSHYVARREECYSDPSCYPSGINSFGDESPPPLPLSLFWPCLQWLLPSEPQSNLPEGESQSEELLYFTVYAPPPPFILSVVREVREYWKWREK